MCYKTEEEIDLIRESSLLVAKTHAEIAGLIEPGVTTLALDKIAEEFIMDNGGMPAFKGYNGFPNTLCMSPNDQIVHGIPRFPAAPAWGLACDSVYERNGALREGKMDRSPRSRSPLTDTNRGRALLSRDGV